MTDYLVAIDPGVSAGVAVFNMEAKKLVRARTLKGRGRSWEQRVLDVASLVFDVGDYYDSPELNLRIRRVVCEYPMFMPTAAGIRTARRGDLVKLAHAVGVLHCHLTAAWGSCELVPVPKWKGQASKDVINRRIFKILSGDEKNDTGLSLDRSHDWDAVGIGLWALGRMKHGSKGR